ETGIPVARIGEPEEVADATFFLASPDATYVNGSTLSVNGGRTFFGDAEFASDLDQEQPTKAAKWLSIMP
ncbi:SDR family oxidoreductase, partial [Sinorhizobium sp. 6-117]|uniref:SDR family oxidoreductase n=1 Tax=Sinorhizobium sp. 6-117 TaxID=3049090 RepID=UPI0024C39F53